MNIKHLITITLALVWASALPLMAFTQEPPDLLLTQLRAATNGLLYQSEAVYVFKLSGKRAAAFLKRVHATDSTYGPAFTFEEFATGQSSYQDWYKEEEKRTADRFRDLFALMRANLRGLTVRYVGCEPVYQLYVFGKDAQGNVIGIRMREVSS